jgi:hypothetical protein
MKSEALVLARLEQEREVTKQLFELLKTPAFALLGAWWANEMAYKLGLYDDRIIVDEGANVQHANSRKEAAALAIGGIGLTYAAVVASKEINLPAIAGILGKVV